MTDKTTTGPGPEVFRNVVSHAERQPIYMQSLQQRAMVWQATEIERLQNEIDALRAELDGAHHNRFYDQRDASFKGVRDGR